MENSQCIWQKQQSIRSAFLLAGLDWMHIDLTCLKDPNPLTCDFRLLCKYHSHVMFSCPVITLMCPCKFWWFCWKWTAGTLKSHQFWKGKSSERNIHFWISIFNFLGWKRCDSWFPLPNHPSIRESQETEKRGPRGAEVGSWCESWCSGEVAWRKFLLTPPPQDPYFYMLAAPKTTKLFIFFHPVLGGGWYQIFLLVVPVPHLVADGQPNSFFGEYIFQWER